MLNFETHSEMLNYWTEEALKIIPPGSTVMSVRYDQDNAMIIELLAPDSETVIGLVPLADDEGNGPGAVHVQVHKSEKNKKSEVEMHILPQMSSRFE